ncbi:hypothetical protein VR45_22670, partial [Streptomyces sp. NRRL S-495]
MAVAAVAVVPAALPAAFAPFALRDALPVAFAFSHAFFHDCSDVVAHAHAVLLARSLAVARCPARCLAVGAVRSGSRRVVRRHAPRAGRTVTRAHRPHRPAHPDRRSAARPHHPAAGTRTVPLAPAPIGPARLDRTAPAHAPAPRSD